MTIEMPPRVRSHSAPTDSWSASPATSGAWPRAAMQADGERRRLHLVAEGGERLQPVPELVERRRQVGARGDGLGDEVEQLVGVDALGPAEPGDGVQAPLDGGAAGAVLPQPHLGAVDVGVDGGAEPLLQGEQQLGRRPPDAGRHQRAHAHRGGYSSVWSRRKRSSSSARKSPDTSSMSPSSACSSSRRT